VRENAASKGRRLLTEGRLRVQAVDEDSGTASAECRGDSGMTYIVGRDEAGRWFLLVRGEGPLLASDRADARHRGQATELSVNAAAVGEFDPMRGKRYQQTRLRRDVVDFLAWLELGGAASRTLDQYERDLSRGCLMFPSQDLAGLEDGDALQIAKSFKPGERRVRVAAWRSFYK
jgi:hypothetical protein